MDMIDSWYGDTFSNYPVLGKMIKVSLSIFHGPQVESSFNTMGDILDSKSGRMNIATFDSIQTVTYSLGAKGKPATSAFSLMPHTTEKRVTTVTYKRKAADEATTARIEFNSRLRNKSSQKGLEDLVERRQRKKKN